MEKTKNKYTIGKVKKRLGCTPFVLGPKVFPGLEGCNCVHILVKSSALLYTFGKVNIAVSIVVSKTLVYTLGKDNSWCTH